MSLKVKTRIRYGKSGKVRTWFRCDDCSMYGDYTVVGMTEAQELFDLFDAKHQCVRGAEIQEAIAL